MTHLERILHHHCLDDTFLERIDQPVAGIECNQFYLAREIAPLNGLRRAHRTWFSRSKYPIEFRMRCQNIFGGRHRLGAIGHAILRGHDLNIWKFLPDSFLKSALPVHCRDGPRRIHHHRDLALAADQFG